jgi:glycosyltransferase involved in cell wall biosynthesis
MSKVSVVVPVYNGERYLQKTLESILVQTYTNYEIICVDDGSKDGSMHILNSYGDRLQVIQQENTGQAGARNAGAKVATGSYIAFLDQDDLWYPSKLELQVQLLEANPEAVMVHCDMDVIDETGNVIQRNIISPTRNASPPKGLTMTRLFGWNPCIYPSTMLIRRGAFDRVGGFDPELPCYGEDIDLMLRLRTEGRFLFLERAGILYRRHLNNCSGSGTDVMFQCAVKFFKKVGSCYVHDIEKKSVLDRFMAQVYSDWGKAKMRSGFRAEARRLFFRALKHYPWKFNTYSRLTRATLPKLW